MFYKKKGEEFKNNCNRERETDRQTEGEKERDRQTDRQTDRERFNTKHSDRTNIQTNTYFFLKKGKQQKIHWMEKGKS